MADSTSLAPRTTIPMRVVTINVVLAVFLSIVVYSIFTFAFVMPRMRSQDSRLNAIEAQVGAMAARAEPAPAPEPAEPPPAQPPATAEAK
jgi:hypothetical protein